MRQQLLPNDPPRLALRVFELCTPRDMQDALVGDLLEEFDCRAAHDLRQARRWFWKQLMAAAIPLGLRRVGLPLGALSAGAGSAIGASVLVGIALERTIGVVSDPGLALVACVATLCALISSTCAALAARRVDATSGKAMLASLGLIVLAPELSHAALRVDTSPTPSLYVPLLLALIATFIGLLIGRKMASAPHSASRTGAPI